MDTKRRNGQAMIELICGLVGVVVLIAMLLQINLISRVHTLSRIEARNAMADSLTGLTPYGSASYLSGWESGSDAMDYSEDDTAKGGSSWGFVDALFTGARVETLETYLPTNRISDITLATESSLVGTFDVTRIEEDADPVEILPAVRKLVYDTDFLNLKHVIFMPWINDVMD
jgi:hypothetical protein